MLQSEFVLEIGKAGCVLKADRSQETRDISVQRLAEVELDT